MSPSRLESTTHTAESRKQNWAVAKSRLETAEALFGSIPDTMTLEEAKAERAGKL